MLHAHGSVAVIPLIPERLDVSTTEHVAIHEQRPALKIHQVGDQKAGERKRGALFGVALAPVEPLGVQLGRHEWCDGQGVGTGLIDAVDQKVGGRTLTRVVSDKNRDRSDRHPLIPC